MGTEPIRCANCGAENTSNSRFCSSCGTPIPPDDATRPITGDEPTQHIPAAAPTERFEPAPAVDDRKRSRTNALLIALVVILAIAVGWFAATSQQDDAALVDDLAGASPSPTGLPSPSTTPAAGAGGASPSPTAKPTASPDPSATPDPLAGVTLYDDCISYDASNLTVTGGGSLWQLTDGGSILTAHTTQADADKMKAVAREHERQCFIGRGNSRPNRSDYIVQYWDGDSGLNSPPFPEDCIPYDNDNLSIEDLGATGWRLREGNKLMELLDNESDAKKAWKLASMYDEQCFIGRGTSRVNQYWNG